MKRFGITLFLLSILTYAQAQWECPSKLAAHLDPTFESPLLSAFETQLSTGVLDGNSISTAMGFVGLDLSGTNNSLYFEGGVKAWWKYDFDENILYDKYRLGLRELFYQYHNNISSFTLGLQSSTFDDHYLLNERIAGANLKLDLGKWKLNAYGGSVTKDFARNGIFCTTGFIYDLSTGQESALLGNSLGDKNMAGFSFTFYPGKEKKTITKNLKQGEDEFEESTDEFQSDDEFGTVENAGFSSLESASTTKTKTNAGIGLESVGIVGYSEFGDWIDNTFYNTGLFASIKLPGEIYLKPEALFQIETSNKGIIYLAELEKSFRLKGGNRLSLSGAYYGFSEIDANATLLNSYSNIMAGEVLRLDAANMPFYLLGLKLNIPSTNFHIKLQNAGQINQGDLNEWDFEIGRKFFDKLHLNAKAGVVNGGELENRTLLGRIEARYYF